MTGKRRSSKEHGRGIASLAAIALTSVTSTAAAGDFHDNGRFFFAPDALATFDFADGAPEPLEPPEEDEPLPVAVASDTALSGGNVVVIEAFQDVDMLVPLPAGPRTLRASVWVRNGEGIGYLVVTRDEENGRGGEINTLYPTGRITSDGWYELANEGLVADGRFSEAVIGVFSPTGVEVDAAEVVIDGTAASPAACSGASDTTSCGEGQVCQWSHCRSLNGWVPPIPEARDDVAAYLENRLRFFFGPYHNREVHMPSALGALGRMQTATDPWSYWNAFMLGVRRLHDGHTTTSGLANFAIDNPKPINVCFVEGEADWSHAEAPADGVYMDVLVSHAGTAQNLGLDAGDRLVAVDGMHPIAWARSLEEDVWSHAAVSNLRTHAEHASGLRRFISRFASELSVIRCDQSGCGEIETIHMEDIPVLEEDEESSFVACDNRPLRHVPEAPENHGGGGLFMGILDESDETENIYGVEWQSLYTTNGSDGIGPALTGAIVSLEQNAARGVIFDHRTGTGGTFGGPAIIWSWAVPSRTLTYFEDRQLAEAERPSLAEGAALFQEMLASGDVLNIGTSNPTDIPVALLITEDVSASDWLPLGMKGAPNVAIFGPYETNGGFSTRYQLSYWLGMSIVLASGDTFIESGFTHNGTGVEPDFVVAPKQSDLIHGIDTVHAAALDWVRQELTP